MKRLVLMLGVLITGLPVVAQSDGPQSAPSGSAMQCPMMSNMSAMQNSMNMDDMMKMMGQRMAEMGALSEKELGVLLAEKQGALGLSDVQVKKVAELVASLQQQKTAGQMERMKEQMRAGGAGCPCPCCASAK